MQLQRSAPAITIRELQTWEQSLGVALPEEFITLYTTHNGGIPDQGYYCPEEDAPWEGTLEITRFLPIKYAQEWDNLTIEGVTESLRGKGMPSYLMPFAIDWGGNMISLNLRSMVVVILYCDLGELDEEAIQDIAPSLRYLLDHLREEDPEDL